MSRDHLEDYLYSPCRPAQLELFALDITEITGDEQDVIRFCNELNPDGTYIRYQGHTWYPLPLRVTGLEISSEGKIPAPTLEVSNIGLTPASPTIGGITYGKLSPLVRRYGDLLGAKLERLRTLAPFLDDGSDPDPNAFYSDTWKVQRKSEETALLITWELSTAITYGQTLVPNRLILRTCPFSYRGEDCGWRPNLADPFPYFDRQGNPSTDPDDDICSQRLHTGCRPRFGGQGLPLRIGGFPAVDFTR